MAVLRHTIAALIALLPAVAIAHPGHPAADTAAGLAHPLSGPDHLLAAVAIGFLAVRSAGSMRFVLPGAFMAAFAAGTALAGAGPGLPLGGTAAVGAMLGLGLLLLLLVGRMPRKALLVPVAGLALIHGGAHGAILLNSAAGALAVASFALGTLLLIGLGATHGGLARTTGEPAPAIAPSRP